MDIKKKFLKIDTYKCYIILGFFLLIRFCNIYGLMGNFIYTNLSRLFFLITLVIYIRNKMISKPVLLVIIYYLIMFISTILNNGEMRNAIMMSYPTIGLVMLMEIGMKRNYYSFISSISKFFKISLLLNSIFDFVLPNAFGEYKYFLGNANQIGIVYIIGFFIIYLDYKLGKKSTFNKRVTILFFLLVSYSLLFRYYSSNNKAAWAITLIVILAYGLYNKLNITPIKIMVTYFITIYLVMYRNIQNYLSGIITIVLGKDLTFSGRTYIWNIVIDAIAKHPILGNGYKQDTNIFFLDHKYSSAYHVQAYFSAHNTYLQEIYYGGVLSLIPLFILSYTIGKKKINCPQIKVMAVACITGLMFIFFFEAVGYSSLFFLYFVIYYLPDTKIKGDILCGK